MTDRTTIEYIGSEAWEMDIKSAQDSWKVVRKEGKEGEVRVVEAEADTGSRYVVVTTPLGGMGQRALGGPVLVTVCAPWHDSWALKWDGPLTAAYVAEHLTDGRWQRKALNGGDLAALTLTVCYALGRPPHFNS